METLAQKITVEAVVKAAVSDVWKFWTEPEHITKWCQASDEWHAPYAENTLEPGKSFKTTMAAKDGSFSFDFGGVYDRVDLHEYIEYTLDDGRKVQIQFSENGDETRVVQTFDAERSNPLEMQRDGWQAILTNFKNYAESRSV
jgi:uncharacterized protein YndB with AHSA1/START domain